VYSNIRPKRHPLIFPKKDTKNKDVIIMPNATVAADPALASAKGSEQPLIAVAQLPPNAQPIEAFIINRAPTVLPPSDSLPPTETPSISQMIFKNDDIPRSRIKELADSRDVDELLDYPELQIAASALKLKGII